MKKAWLISLLLTGWLGYLSAQEVLRGHLYFETDAFLLTDSHQDMLQGWLDSLQHLEWESLTIEAHTDSVGSLSYNKVLSARRAASVKRYVLGKGIDNETLQVAFFGESTPLRDNGTEATRRYNRRVDLVARLTTTHKPIDLVALYKPLQTAYQFFYADLEADTAFKTSAGVLLGVRQQSFLCSNGTVYAGKAEIRVLESISRGDMLRNNLSTNTPDQLLETGGMLEVRAYGSCGELTVNPDAPITIMMPTRTPQEDMTLFTTEGRPGEAMDWDVHDQTVQNQGFFSFGIYRGKVFRTEWQERKRFVKYQYSWFKRVSLRIKETVTGDPVEWGYWTEETVSRIRMSYEQRYGSYRGNRLGDLAQDGVSYYTFNLPNLGWINCDRFTDVPPEQKVDFAVELPEDPHVDIKLVFTDMNSIMSGSREGDRIVFRNVPRGSHVQVVGLRINKQQSGFGIRHTVISDDVCAAPTFENMGLDDLKNRLASL